MRLARHALAAVGAVCLCLLSIVHSVAAEDWAQWRGPKRDGISRETGLLKEWPAAGPSLVWQLSDVGSGYGTGGREGQAVPAEQ
jgi:hypothetical protein